MLVANIDPRSNDAAREDPFLYIEVDGWLDRRRPFVERKEIDRGKCINAVDSKRYKERNPEVSVCKEFETRGGMKIVETLLGS